MNILVIGLGSMGKRRIRCLQALGFTGIFGFDTRADRCKEAEQRYRVSCFSDFEEAWAAASPEAVIISVPPDIHTHYMRLCVDTSVPFFVEASVVSDGLEAIHRDCVVKKLLAAPSATLCFHPGIQQIRRIVKSGRLGKISNILMHSGQYLPDWHTYEKVEDYYVSNPLTGGAREIVPFELTWLIDIFGLPRRVGGNVRKTIDIEGAQKIDDTYNCLLDFGGFLGVLTVDVVSRYATRRLMVNGSKAQLTWAWEDNAIRLYDPAKGQWEIIPYSNGEAASGYNPNIGEQMYIDEIRAFTQSIITGSPFPNSLQADISILGIMEKIEASDQRCGFIEV